MVKASQGQLLRRMYVAYIHTYVGNESSTPYSTGKRRKGPSGLHAALLYIVIVSLLGVHACVHTHTACGTFYTLWHFTYPILVHHTSNMSTVFCSAELAFSINLCSNVQQSNEVSCRSFTPREESSHCTKTAGMYRRRGAHLPPPV